MMVFDILRSSVTGLSLSLAAFAGAAQAADLPSRKAAPVAPIPPSITWIDAAISVKAMTDYNFRGISQTDRKPAIQGGVELQFYNNLVYAGVYASNLDLVTRPDAEIDFYAGIRPKFGDLTFDFGVWQYYYPGEKQFIFPAGVFWTPKNTDYTEVYGKVSYTYKDSLTVGANVFYAWDWLGTGASGTYASITAKYALPFLEGLSVSGEFGHYWLGRTNQAIWSTTPPTNLPDYLYWNAGVSYTYKNLTADVRYHDTNLSKRECFLNTTDPRGVISGSASSKWCGPTVVGTLSFDITASSLGIFAPAK
ncbi:uncharacterized protein (TIGR02001 family) [Bosea sp. OAE506]|uniref:TorF family putative porin n=1 Tax=Bosea sp. OAE506 TaxID=2663870 RepID=UPI0033967EE7